MKTEHLATLCPPAQADNKHAHPLCIGPPAAPSRHGYLPERAQASHVHADLYVPRGIVRDDSDARLDVGKQFGWRHEQNSLDLIARAAATIPKGGEDVGRSVEHGHVLMRDKVTLDNMLGAIDRSIRLGLGLATN